MTCIIIEDQPPAQRILKRYIEDLGSVELVATFSDAVQAMTFLQAHSVDLIFLDIHLPKLSGIEFLKSLAHAPSVILTTAFPDYALESYDLNVTDYLLKPFSFQRFVKAVAKVSPTATKTLLPTSEKNTEYLFIKSGYEHIRVTISSILFIQSSADYTELHTPTGKLLSTEPLRYWLESLDATLFFRVHKSYIINTDKIIKIARAQVHLEGKIVIPIGRAYKESFHRAFLK